MLISGAAGRMMDDVAARERAAAEAFEPVMPEQPGPLSAAAPDGAYFITEDSADRRLYTAGGSFSLRDGVLSDRNGYPLLGFRRSGGALETLRMDPVDLTLGYAGDVNVTPGGDVGYERRCIDPRSGRIESRWISMGRLALARFPAATKLQAVDLHHAAAPPGVTPHTGSAGDGSFGAIQPFPAEHSAAQLDSVLERMQEAYLAIDALRAAAKADDGVKKTAMDLLK